MTTWGTDLDAEKARRLAEQERELARLRAENATLRMEREILKKAAAFFAKDHA